MQARHTKFKTAGGEVVASGITDANGSTKSVLVKAEPMAYLRLDTGEVSVIPAADMPSLHNVVD